jgi:hypothetical protein
MYTREIDIVRYKILHDILNVHIYIYTHIHTYVYAYIHRVYICIESVKTFGSAECSMATSGKF